MVSVVIPAHNEGRVLGRLLEALAPQREPVLDVVVVANGCSDDTVEVARRYPVTVLDIPEPSKAIALERGDEVAAGYPRLYVDADIVLTREALEALCKALTGGVHASAPQRSIPLGRAHWAVRAYYRFWRELPVVREGLFGRGVIAVDETGHERLVPWGRAMADDLRASLSFAPAERTVVPGASVVIMPPRTYRDLLARRVRAMTGNAMLAAGESRGTSAGAGGRAAQVRTSLRDVLGVLCRRPTLALPGAVFVVTALLAKAGGARRARRGDNSWLRDESSRT